MGAKYVYGVWGPQANTILRKTQKLCSGCPRYGRDLMLWDFELPVVIKTKRAGI